MSDTKPTIEEQIACMSDIQSFGNDMRLSILASLKELQSIRAAELPVEPEILQDLRDGMSIRDNPNLSHKDGKILSDYIDALKSYAQKEKERADRTWRVSQPCKVYGCQQSALWFIGEQERKRAEKADAELAALNKEKP